MLNKDDRFLARLDHAFKKLDEDAKQDVKNLISNLRAEVLKAKPEICKWLVDNIEPAVLAFINYFTEKLK